MSGAFRKRKTEKTKSALNLFYAFFLEKFLRQMQKLRFQNNNTNIDALENI